MKNVKAEIIVSHIIEKIQILCGILLVAFWSMGIIVSLVHWSRGGVVISLFFWGIGVLLILKAKKTKRLLKLFKIYVPIIASDPTGSITHLAETVGTSGDIVKKNLKLMIKRNYFINACINEEKNCIILVNKENTLKANVNELNTYHGNKECRSVLCKNCGATSKVIIGSNDGCEYCGSPLHIN